MSNSSTRPASLLAGSAPNPCHFNRHFTSIAPESTRNRIQVKFIGNVEFGTGQYVGVELDEPIKVRRALVT
jgi:hypothetical protein